MLWRWFVQKVRWFCVLIWLCLRVLSVSVCESERECVCVCGGGVQSRCSRADSSALCILKPTIATGGKDRARGCVWRGWGGLLMGGYGWRWWEEGWQWGVWEGGEGRSDIAPQGAPFLIAPLASVYLIRHDQQNRGGERRWGRGGGGAEGRGLMVLVKLGQISPPLHRSQRGIASHTWSSVDSPSFFSPHWDFGLFYLFLDF